VLSEHGADEEDKRKELMTEKTFEPTILAFACQHCAYAAADLAGSLRIQYPPSVRIVRVPCSGRVEVTEILHAFERGVDGGMVAG
jgi:F420-non-reducing hydrogenase iron-sulfur subunit